MATEQTEVKPCCVTGHLHKGEPLGSFSVEHGLRTYVSTPSNPSSGKQDTVILISDIFGVDLVNTKLVADEWAGQGYRVLLPDFFEGGAIGHDKLNVIVPNLRLKKEMSVTTKATNAAQTAANLGPFLLSNREAVARPKVEAFVKAVKEEPNTGKIAVVGFCWGARYALLLCQPSSPAKPDVVIANHPSFLVNADVEPITDVPVLVQKGSEDDIMDEKALDEVEAILKKNLGDKAQVERFPDAVHGFTVRGDLDNPKEHADKEKSTNNAFAFVKKYI